MSTNKRGKQITRHTRLNALKGTATLYFAVRLMISRIRNAMYCFLASPGLSQSRSKSPHAARLTAQKHNAVARAQKKKPTQKSAMRTQITYGWSCLMA